MKSYLILAVLVVMGIVGAVLVFTGATDADRMGSSNVEGLLMLGGFFLFVAAIAGVLAFLVRLIPRGMDLGQGARWEQTRIQGKRKYVANFLLRTSAVAIAAILWMIFIVDYPEEVSAYRVAANYAVLALIILGIAFVAAGRFWHENEREYNELRSKADVVGRGGSMVDHE